jgi:hypothetical protein
MKMNAYEAGATAADAVQRARETLAGIQAEDTLAAERLRKIAEAPALKQEDVLLRENCTRLRSRLVGEQEQALQSLQRALDAEQKAVRNIDGTDVVFGNPENPLLGPTGFGMRSSMMLDSTPGMGGPRPLPAGSRIRAVAGVGVQCALADGPQYEMLPFCDVHSSHPAMSARIIERPEAVGMEGAQTVLLTTGGNVASMRLVCGAHGLLGLRVETGSETLFIPSWNCAYATLHTNLPGTHFIVAGGWQALRLLKGAELEQAVVPFWSGQLAPLPAMRVIELEAREGEEFLLANSQRSLSKIAPVHSGISMETAGDVGVSISFHDRTTLFPWAKIRCAVVEWPA